MKGLLYLIESAAEKSNNEAVIDLLKYFRQTNPWSIQHGMRESVLDNTDL